MGVCVCGGGVCVCMGDVDVCIVLLVYPCKKRAIIHEFIHIWINFIDNYSKVSKQIHNSRSENQNFWFKSIIVTLFPNISDHNLKIRCG